MKTVEEIIAQPEGRRIEFKEKLPSGADLAKTVVAFANDAGGDIFFGIRNNPREIKGLAESDLIILEEKISNIIHDHCSPAILPEISFLKINGKHLLKLQIFKGSNPPYFLKMKPVIHGTYIRVGSSNRLADEEIISELRRQQSGKSFDSELIFEKQAENIEYVSLEKLFHHKTDGSFTLEILQKLELVKQSQGVCFPTRALILLSDDHLKRSLFPYAKTECARFKGENPGFFIDQKTFDGNILDQCEHAYQFVLRHISQTTVDYVGVHRHDRWEYPVLAIREAIRNAVIHRDYSLSGMDIKIAVFDDKIEITSPGKLPPSVDFNEMYSGQSSVRNKTLAPVFRRLGIIEQWGNGLKLIGDELKKYPEIGFEWKEPGMNFRVIFFKKGHNSEPEMVSEPVAEYKVKRKPVNNRDRILNQINANPGTTRNELQMITGLSYSAIRWNIAKLKQEGKIPATKKIE